MYLREAGSRQRQKSFVGHKPIGVRELGRSLRTQHFIRFDALAISFMGSRTRVGYMKKKTLKNI